MAVENILKRGFKANCEKLAIEYREKLELHPWESLCALKVADYLEVKVCDATEFLSLPNEIEFLSGNNGKKCEWSALTMKTKVGNRIIIYNPFNSLARQQSDLMHELAHIICKHEHLKKEFDFILPFGLREFDIVQEEEAKCLGATLQITRPGLFWAKKKNMTNIEIATHFNASVDMVKYRLNTSGVTKQLSYMRK